MTGARLVHDTLEQEGWSPIWLPDPSVRDQRELARFRMHLVHHKSALKNRVHSTLINFGRPCPVTDLFGAEGRRLLARLDVPQPWRSNVCASLELIDHLERQIDQINRRLRAGHADHRYIPLLMSVPGVRWVLAFTIAAEIGEIGRFSSPQKLTGYTGLCPRVDQSGERDRRGPLSKHGPSYLRWALLEATMHALRHPAYSERYQRTKKARQAARRQGRPGRHRPLPGTRDLAHADPKRTLRSPRRRVSSGGLTALFGHAPRAKHPISPDPPAEEAIET
jgi:transposase